MLKKVYIASALPNRLVALDMAQQLRDAKIIVVSTWHDMVESCVEVERAMSYKEKALTADQCFAEIDDCTHLVWLFGNAGERTGAPIEFGYAAKGGKILITVPAVVSDLPGSPVPAAPSVFSTRSLTMSLRSAISALTHTTLAYTILQIGSHTKLFACK